LKWIICGEGWYKWEKFVYEKTKVPFYICTDRHSITTGYLVEILRTANRDLEINLAKGGALRGKLLLLARFFSFFYIPERS